MKRRIVYLDAMVSHDVGRHLFEETERGLRRSTALAQGETHFDYIPIGPVAGKNPVEGFADLLMKAPTALVLSGSEKSVTAKGSDPWVKSYLEALQKFLEAWRRLPKPFPILAICFAHQATADVFGGEVRSSGSLKVGPVEVKNALGVGSDRYLAYHEDQVVKAPHELTPIYVSDYCPYQGFRHKELPLITTQFHPEMSENILQISEDREVWKNFSAEDLRRQSGAEFLADIGNWFYEENLKAL